MSSEGYILMLTEELRQLRAALAAQGERLAEKEAELRMAREAGWDCEESYTRLRDDVDAARHGNDSPNNGRADGRTG